MRLLYCVVYDCRGFFISHSRSCALLFYRFNSVFVPRQFERKKNLLCWVPSMYQWGRHETWKQTPNFPNFHSFQCHTPIPFPSSIAVAYYIACATTPPLAIQHNALLITHSNWWTQCHVMLLIIIQNINAHRIYYSILLKRQWNEIGPICGEWLQAPQIIWGINRMKLLNWWVHLWILWFKERGGASVCCQIKWHSSDFY